MYNCARMRDRDFCNCIFFINKWSLIIMNKSFKIKNPSMFTKNGKLLKKYQPFYVKGLDWSHKISTRSGTCVKGIVYPLPPLVNIKQSCLWATPTANSSIACSMKAAKKEADRLHPQGRYTLATQIATRMWPTPCSNTRPNEGNVRLLRAKVVAGELSREEATSMLNGKDPFEAQGVIPAIKWPTPCKSDHLANNSETLEAWEKRSKKCKDRGVNLQFALRHAAQKASGVNGGKLNPVWVEWLMGYPKDWTK